MLSKESTEIQRLDAVLVIDPLFWQALGKSIGWKEKYTIDDPEWRTLSYGKMLERTPKNMCIRFHTINYTEGWQAAVEYLESLTVKEK